jgi:hypothetical protein
VHGRARLDDRRGDGGRRILRDAVAAEMKEQRSLVVGRHATGLAGLCFGALGDVRGERAGDLKGARARQPVD